MPDSRASLITRVTHYATGLIAHCLKETRSSRLSAFTTFATKGEGVIFGGALAMGLTAGIGYLFGAAIG